MPEIPRVCLQDGEEIEGPQIQVMVAIDDGNRSAGYKPVPETMCVEHGKNGHNVILRMAYDELLNRRINELLGKR